MKKYWQEPSVSIGTVKQYYIVFGVLFGIIVLLLLSGNRDCYIFIPVVFFLMVPFAWLMYQTMYLRPYYIYREKCISFRKKKEIPYNAMKAICLVNGNSVTSMSGPGGFFPPIVLKEKRADGSIREKQQAYVTIHRNTDCVKLLERRGISINNVYVIYKSKGSSLLNFECIFESLSELLTHVESLIYIREEVYWRFREELEKVFKETAYDKEKVHIVGNFTYSYWEYIKRIKYEYYPEEIVVDLEEAEIRKRIYHENKMMQMFGKLCREYEKKFQNIGMQVVLKQYWRIPGERSWLEGRPGAAAMADCFAVCEIYTIDGKKMKRLKWEISVVKGKKRWEGMKRREHFYLYLKNSLGVGEQELEEWLKTFA